MPTLPSGANVTLTKEIPDLKGVLAGIGWSTDGDTALNETLTVAAILCDTDGRALSAEHVVFFNQPVSPDLSTALVQCTSTYDKAHFEIDFTLAPAQVARVALVLYLNEGVGTRRTLGQLRRCHVRVLNLSSRSQIAGSADLADTFGTETATVLADVYRHDGGWKFKVTNQGFSTGIDGVFDRYGVSR
ncbi:TerD family protein [Pedococcus sp. KACC 23699]|uniref:TerD family protein n=1 Tax=Pedococcus sp. KACC 23699 TaxID=3149228 RepID=A0AAU7JXV7_9MICO